MAESDSVINLREKFQHLTKAPIVEAALDIRFVPSTPWDETSFQENLKRALPDYPKVEIIRETRFKISHGKPDDSGVEDLGCIGFKLQSNDNLHIAQFNRAAFVFSRLKPYEDWGQFNKEALRLFAIHYGLLHPTGIARIGLRFINLILLSKERADITHYYKYPPQSPRDLNWPLTGFLNHDVLRVPGTSYSVNLIKTIQPTPTEVGLILDIDVFMQKNFDYNEPDLVKYLDEMRWVKNKIFFSNLTDAAIKEFV